MLGLGRLDLRQLSFFFLSYVIIRMHGTAATTLYTTPSTLLRVCHSTSESVVGFRMMRNTLWQRAYCWVVT